MPVGHLLLAYSGFPADLNRFVGLGARKKKVIGRASALEQQLALGLALGLAPTRATFGAGNSTALFLKVETKLPEVSWTNAMTEPFRQERGVSGLWLAPGADRRR
jgi:hypothetical protein